ncbi:MAG: hypothetical protein Q4D04_11705 [Clostridia bacterium]|nr:hypothetical protein [Clostridia bacterium]
MPLFDNSAEKQRKQNLKELEDKRVAFADMLKQKGYVSEKSIYGQTGGGFHGIALSNGSYLYIEGPSPGEDADFLVREYPSVRATVEEVFIQSEGMGGLLGFGKKGGVGFKLLLIFPDGESGDIEIVAGQNCAFENERGIDPLFSTKRRRGDANFVWEFRPVEQSSIIPMKERWLKRLGSQDK